jgi:hypothetical protein
LGNTRALALKACAVTDKGDNVMPVKYLLAAVTIALLSLSACATTGTGGDNTTYATPLGIGPVRGNIGGY